MSIKKPSFIIDLSSSMVISSSENVGNEKGQELHCNCGNIQKFNNKLVRNIIKNYDELTEDSESVKSITCKSCKIVYNNLEKLYLLETNSPEIYSVNYEIEQKSDSHFLLKRIKYVAEYKSINKKIEFTKSLDFLEINAVDKSSLINISLPYINTSETTAFTKGGKKENEKNNFIKEIDITNVQYLEEFFAYSDSVVYSGFENIIKSLNITKSHIKDLDKFDSVYFIDFIKSKSKVEMITSESGCVNYFQNLDSGFGDGKTIKKSLNCGDYLFNTMNSYKLLVSMISFENASCIIHTKGYDFFKNWTESNYICKPELYLKHKATNPHSIMEISMTKSSEGDSIKEFLENKSDNIFNKRLKISSTIYNSIKVISQLKTLQHSYIFGIANKEQLEFLFQNYESNRVYSCLSKLSNKRLNDNIILNFKNVKHILDCNLDEYYKASSDYVTIYKDTLRVIDLLEVKDKVIFKCKNYKQLKDLHDDYSSRYNAMKDAKKSEFYLKAVAPFHSLNSQVGDVKFEVVDTAERLNLEGLQMHHCIYTYLNRICDKSYLAINVTHTITNERATAGFMRKGDSLLFEQLKGYYNSRATQELILATFQFCDNFNISTTKSYSSDMQSDKSRERQMPGQMSEEEFLKIKKNNGDTLGGESKNIKKQESHIVKSFIKKIFK